MSDFWSIFRVLAHFSSIYKENTAILGLVKIAHEISKHVGNAADLKKTEKCEIYVLFGDFKRDLQPNPIWEKMQTKFIK